MDALLTKCRFRDSLNHYLYGIALTHDNLESVRSSSCLLSAAIFTVASLHLPQHHHLFPKCCKQFLNLVSSSMFDRRHRLDDVRALCIGAFWLAELSWKLSGHAVRIATELGIHQSFRKALAGSPGHFERARLWYLLYVCDHHFSIAYGRPPVIHDHEPMREWELFVSNSQAIQGDSRVCSQVSLFVVLTQVYDCYEAESEKEISDEDLGKLAGFDKQLDQWRTRWTNKLGIPSSRYDGHYQTSNQDQTGRNEYVGDYPNQGVDLHYNFAKLQVNSLSLRAATMSTINNPSSLRKEHANIAINSAFSVLSVVLDNPDIRDSLVGVPLYVTTMIAFAAVFLLKVTARWRGIGFSPIHPEQVWEQVGRVIKMLKEKRAGEQHIIHHVAAGLEKMLRKCIELANSSSPFDDSRLWDNSYNTTPTQSHHPAHVQHVDSRMGESMPPYQMPPGPPVHGQGPMYIHQQHQPHHGYSATHIGPLSTPLSAPPSAPQSAGSTPEAMYTQALGQQQMYEVNGQYLPMHMGVFDFLSPQLPY